MHSRALAWIFAAAVVCATTAARGQDGDGQEADAPLAASSPATAVAPAVAPPGTAAPAPNAPTDGTLVYNFGQHPLVNVADGDIQVTAENSTVAVQSGYSPLRVIVRNVGRDVQTVGLEFNCRGTASATIRRNVEVPAGGRVATILPVPAGATYGELSVHARGITKGGSSPLYFTNATQAMLALGSDEQFQTAVRRPPDFSSYTTMVRTLPSDEAPAEVASYVGFGEVVVLTPFEEISESGRRALEAYAATGGTLIVTRPLRAPEKYFPLLASANSSEATRINNYGFGSLRICGTDALACAQGIATDLGTSPQVVRPSATRSYVNRYSYDYNGNAMPEAERFLLPQATAPVGRFLLIILAFTLAIGPGSVWVARKRGPPMLLLTIPGTALVTCLLIVGYSVLVDGFAIHAATRSYTLLDSKNKRAITVGVAAYYANIAPRDAEFDVTTVVIAPPYAYNSEQVPSVDWTHGTKLASDFIPSRTYREWGVVGVQPTRARLLVKSSGDGFEIQNALGSDIRVARARIGGVDWVVRGLRDGGSAQAVRETGSPTPVPEPDLVEFSSRFDPRVGTLTKAVLSDGQFIAQVAGPGLLPEGGLSVTHHSAEQLVRGEVER